MNKKLKFIIAGMAIVAGLASAVSCQDLSKDVDDLGKRVSALESTVKDLQARIDAGAVITDVTSTATGVKVTLSNGKSFDLTNGKDGADGKDGAAGAAGAAGSVVTIGENGNWFIDGVDTGKAAVGQNGKDGDSIVWAVSEDGKKFVEYKNGVATGNTVDIPAAQGAITAVWDAEKGVLTLYGAENAEEGLPIVLYNNAAAPAAISLVEAYSGYLGTDYYPTQGHILGCWGDAIIVPFSNVIEKANVFEEGIENAITFEEGKQTPVGATFIVRVSPANYELKPEDISFVNAEGTVYDEIKAKEVNAFKGKLTKSEAKTGLWAVYVELEKYDKKQFDGLTWIDVDKDGDFNWHRMGGEDFYISYAIKAQEAVSTYDLSFEYEDFLPATYLDFYVGEVLKDAISVDFLNNRYQKDYAAGENPSLKQPGETKYQELTWDLGVKGVPAVEPILKGDKKNVEVDAADNRGTLPTYKAVLGEEINIFAGDWVTATTFEYAEQIKAMYVTLDDEANAIESAPSEWNAWMSYVDGIEGLNEVQLGQKATITINKKSADGDIIGFRVYAVNLDGTLVDPDGRAFYVQVGKAGDELDAINTVMNTFEHFSAMKSGEAKAEITKKISAAKWVFSMGGELATKDPVEGVFTLLDKDGNVLIAANAPLDGADLTLDLTKIAKATFEPTYDEDTDGNVDLWAYVDDFTYQGEFIFFNSDDFVVATLPVSFTKTLPASITKVPVKTSQLGADGIYRCFLVPANWTAYDTVKAAQDAGQKGTIDMLSIFNFPKDDPKGYEITFANADKVMKSGKLVAADKTVVPTKTLAEDAALDAPENQLEITYLDLIDNKTQHTTKVVYNMGPVSSKLIDPKTGNVADYTLDAGTFPTIFFCIYNDDAKYGWPWKWNITKAQYEALFPENKSEWKATTSVPAIVYEDFDGKTIDPTYIIGNSLWDGKYKGSMPTGYDNTIKVQGVKFVTKGGDNDGEEEYYTVDTAFKFTKKSGATNPTAPVASSLVITYTDMYGHKETCTMDAKVMPRK